MMKPKVAVIMGSRSDWETMKAAAVEMLDLWASPAVKKVVSAQHGPRICCLSSPKTRFAGGIQVITGAGGGAPSGHDRRQDYFARAGVPVQSKALKESTPLSIAQMPRGIPVGTLAIGEAGAANAGLLAAGILALNDTALRKRLEAFRKKQTKKVMTERV